MKSNHNNKVKSNLSWAIATLFAFIALVISILPFFYMILNSFKNRFEMLMEGIFTLPQKLDISNYTEVLSGGFLGYFANSVLLLVISLVLILFISACASYPLARFNFKLRNPLYAIIIACMAIPIHVTLIPVFKMSQTLKIYDSLLALIGPNVAFALPVSVFILTGFMASIEPEIEEAAEIDGCNKYQMFFRIMFPLAKPGLATLAIYNGVNIWNEFSFANTLTQSAEHRTLPLAVWDYQGQYVMNTPMIMAILTLTVLPMIIFFAFAQERLVKGMTAGAVKG
jgi:raffinose/stachyose/melibiose transport system permease protein